ncbi:MAG: flagellar hook protein FlgE [Beijerinckiaceae bacterium]
MGIFGAMTTAVSGLKSQSYAMENISGNIANSRTTGFKRVDTSFVDLIPDTPRKRELAGSVAAFSQSTNTIQGDLNTTGVGTNIAINGEGFFVVQERTGYAGNQPTFAGIDLYTRRGDFELDRSGYMVNGAGFFLKGIRMDPVTQDLIGSQPGVIRVDGDNIPARPTGELEYRANLPEKPQTNASNTNPGPGGWLLAGGPWGAGAPAAVSATDETAFLNQTISGGSTTTYNVQGAPVNVQMRWGKTSNTTGAETWNLYYQSDAAATGAATKWSQIPGGTFTFDISGQPTTPATLAGLSLTVNGTAIGPFSLATALTQYADSDVESKGSVRVTKLSQDGYPSGELTSITIGDGGRVQGNYTNGQVVGLYQLSIAQFSADNGLKRRDGGVFEQTIDSGPPVITDAGRAIVGGAVENSNTDIADEFAKMIVTQQAYSANTRVISTSSDMLREAINIVR